MYNLLLVRNPGGAFNKREVVTTRVCVRLVRVGIFFNVCC